ncbi:hypothetical protein SK128_016842 [Halocaridina rubra]|uniref:Uncharacterized protein n=1 Tax=Halocaridina rubra TaxID=373956 RepID=A0AAN9ACB4_HALRR
MVIHALLTFFFFFSFQQQAWCQFLPEKEKMCGVIVDKPFQEGCLQCFEDAGPLSVNPEGVRECVATYLPPLVAKCAVPQARKFVERIEQNRPVVHPNNTNANLLPNCVKRRMRELERYLQKENLFTTQAGDIVKTVILTKLLRNGGANMLGVISQRDILKLPSVRNLVENYASSCIDDYENSRALPKIDLEFFDDDDDEEDDDDDDDDDVYESNEERDFDLEALKKIMKSGPNYQYDKVYKAEKRAKPSESGNGLPYGGTNDLAKDMILGECIIDKLIESNKAIYLISTLSAEEFYHPIPYWWAGKLLYYYKAYRESLLAGK